MDPICCYFHLYPRPRLLLRQSAPLPFLLPVVRVRCGVPSVELLAFHKHVALVALGVRLVTIFQDHNSVLPMAVRKVNQEVGPILIPTKEPLYQAPDLQQTFREIFPVSLFLLCYKLWKCRCEVIFLEYHIMYAALSNIIVFKFHRWSHNYRVTSFYGLKYKDYYFLVQ